LLPWASRSRVCLVRPVARQSYGHTMIGKPVIEGLLVHPERTQGQQPPSPMVLIGSAKQSRRTARPERRRSQRRPTKNFFDATRFVLVEGVTVKCSPRVLPGQNPKTPTDPPLRSVLQTHNTLAIPRWSAATRFDPLCPTGRTLSFHPATARLNSRSNRSSSLVDTWHRRRHYVNPDCKAVEDRCWWTSPAPTANRRVVCD
jgi:hypothetical protein